MVDLFFVLSGFVIFNAYGRKIDTHSDLVRFQILRLGRLYPVHLLFLLAFVFIEMAKYIAQQRFGIESANSQPFRENDMVALAQQLFLIQAIGPSGKASTFNVPAWSISVELYTYLVFGMAVLLFKNKKIYFFGFFVITGLLVLLNNVAFGYEEFLRCLVGFFLGCLTASALNKLKIALPRWLSFVLIILIAVFLCQKTTRHFDTFIYLLTSALIIALVLQRNGWLNRTLKYAGLTWLGAISYSVYMSHYAVEWAVNQVVRLLLKKPEIVVAGGRSTPQLSGPETLVALISIVAIVLFISWIVHDCLEQPLREKCRCWVADNIK